MVPVGLQCISDSFSAMRLIKDGRMELFALVGWDGSAQAVFSCIMFSFLFCFVQLIFGQWDALWLSC